MILTSPYFVTNDGLARDATCEGKDVNPPFDIYEVPKKAKSLAIIFCDIDSPQGIYNLWVVWNINPKTKHIDEGMVPEGAVEGVNSYGKKGFLGACLKSGTHRYKFILFALDAILDLPQSTTGDELREAMRGHLIEETEMHARFM